MTRTTRRRGRNRRRAVTTILAVLTLVIISLPVATAPAQANRLYGHDVSWPQCSVAQGGFGLPMPPSNSAFVIVGLTRGLALTKNPCLATQYQWVRSNGKPAHAYTMATYPTAAQLTAHGSSGPWGTATLADRLRNVGYAQARFALETLAEVGWSPPVVWIDVEPRPLQPWPSTTAQQRLDNRHLLTGLLQGLRDGGVGTGFYSYIAGWQEITGSWQLPSVPVWATAGRLDYPNEALDRCVQPSFSGGPVLISQWYDDTRDYNLTCGSYAFTSFGASTFYLNNSFGPVADIAFHFGNAGGQAFVGDWNGDGRDTPAVRTGNTFHIRDANSVGPADRRVSYGRADDVVLVGDWNGDRVDTFAVRRGAAYHIKNSVSSGPADVVVTYGRAGDEVLVGDWNGDGRDTLAVRRGATYYIKNTLSDGSADVVLTYGRPDDVVLVGDWNGDGRDTLAVRRGATYHIKNTLSGGTADVVVTYGRPGDIAFTGDWNGDGRDTLGIRRLS